MQIGNAVRRVGEVDVHVGHVNAVIPVDDGQTLVGGAGAGQRVELSMMGMSCGTTASR